MNIIKKFTYLSQEPNQMNIILDILQIYNPRASEILEATYENFFPNEFLILIGKKKSTNVIIRDRILLNAIAQLPRIHPTKIFPSITYDKLYKYCKRNYSHLFVRFKKKKNLKVTHGFRYRNVEKIGNQKIIRDILHHRSIKSGKFYKKS